MKIIKQVPDCKVMSVLRVELRSLGNLELLAPRTELRLHEDKDKDEGSGEDKGEDKGKCKGKGKHEHEGEEDADNEVVGYHAEFTGELYNLETADSEMFEHALRKVCVSVTLKGTYAATTALACRGLYYGDRTIAPRSTIILHIRHTL